MRLGNRRGFLGAALQEWFREIHLHPAPSYAVFAEKLPAQATWLSRSTTMTRSNGNSSAPANGTFRKGMGFGLAPWNSSGVLVLKLHGSMNWLVSVLGGATGGAFIVNPASSLGDHPVIHRADLEFLGYQEFSGHTYQSGGAFPCLILPGRTKEFFYDTSFGHEYAAFWDHLWSQACHGPEGMR